MTKNKIKTIAKKIIGTIALLLLDLLAATVIIGVIAYLLGTFRP